MILGRSYQKSKAEIEIENERKKHESDNIDLIIQESKRNTMKNLFIIGGIIVVTYISLFKGNK
jgi:hypothetical protein